VFTEAHIDIIRDIKEKRLGVLHEADGDVPRATAADVRLNFMIFISKQKLPQNYKLSLSPSLSLSFSLSLCLFT
jgi:hypothetical protein